MRRRLFFKQRIDEGSSGDRNKWNGEKLDRFMAVAEPSANLISSMVADDIWAYDNPHAPTLDIDLPCELRESSPGKYHLYIDKTMEWCDYRMLLDVLAKVGIIERGYADASIAKGASCLRKPGTFKNVAMTRNSFDPNTEVVIPRAQYEAMQALFVNATPEQPGEVTVPADPRDPFIAATRPGGTFPPFAPREEFLYDGSQAEF